MKNHLWLACAAAAVLTATSVRAAPDKAPEAAPAPAAAAASASANFDQAAALAKLQKEIAGKEDKPSSEVFKNIKMLKGVPAGKLLKIMEFGWSRGLGVSCTHCHVADKWDSDEKRQKQATREMGAFTEKINKELLPAVGGLRKEEPTPHVNCMTCHRGHVKPALDLDK